MEVFIKVLGKIILSMVMEFNKDQIHKSIKENGSKELEKEKEN